MNDDGLTDHLVNLVRVLLRRYPPFAGMTRDDIDNNVLGDLARTIERDLEDWITATEYEIRDEIETDLKYEAEYEAEMKAAAKKERRAKARGNTKTGEAA
jgi:hypothetical protein